MRRIAPFLLTALLLAGACTPDQGPGPGGPTTPEPTGTVPAVNAADAELLPEFADSLPDTDPETFRELLDQLDGTPVLINFWGSWCAPCVKEAPALAEAHETYGDRVQFIGVAVLDDRAGARGFIERFGWRYPSLFDSSPNAAVHADLGLVGQPVTVIFDATGMQTLRHPGEITADDLEAALEAVV